MGVERNIEYQRFPKQGTHLGKAVKVCYHYEPSRTHFGMIVRDDAEDPYKIVIMVYRPEGISFLLSTECQFKILD